MLLGTCHDMPSHISKQMTSFFHANPIFSKVFLVTEPLIPVDPKALAILTPPDVQITEFLIIVTWGFSSFS